MSYKFHRGVKMSIEQQLVQFADLGRINISFNPAFGTYRVSILSITVVSEGFFLPCRAEAPTIEESSNELYYLLKNADKLIYGRFSDEEREVKFYSHAITSAM